jgi:hypothetical protein
MANKTDDAAEKLCQTFVLTPAMKVAVDPSMEQSATILAYIIK